MALLIDGNNVIGQTPGWHRDRPGSRRRLLGELAGFVAATRTRTTVVFDGAPDPDVPDGSVFKGVRVLYPPRGVDADTVIERLIAMAKDRRGITVVTSDRRLALECRAAGARVMRSGDFRRKMAEVAESRAAKDQGETEQPLDGSVEEWLRYFGCDPEKN
jgi:predicted RNA-binding protein with PIN domain